MSLVIIIILIALQLTAVVVQFASSEGKLLNNRYSGIKKINGRGWTVVAFSLITVFLSGLLYTVQNSEAQEALDKQSKKAEEYHLSEIDALAKYGLKFDSSERSIKKFIEDIPKKDIVPVLEVCSTHPNAISIEKYDSAKQEIILAYWICALDASARNIDLKLRVVVKDSNKKYFLLETRGANVFQVFTKETIGVGTALQGSYGLSGTIRNIDAIFFYFYGTHSNSAGKKFKDSFWAAYSIRLPDYPKEAKHFGRPSTFEYENLKKYELK